MKPVHTRMQVLKLVLILVLTILATGCAAAPPPPPSGGTPTARATAFEKEIAVSNAGEVTLSVRASAPGTAWNRAQAEAATVSLYVDGRYQADIVLFRGETAFTYEVAAGALSQGTHHLAMYYEPLKSAPEAKQVRVEDVAVRVYARDDPLYQVMAHAPILYGREDARSTDTPLFMYHEVIRGAGTSTIQYTIIFSNEDGGTAPDGLMARWGRLTDIEWVYRVVLDAEGAVVKEEYQDKDHNTAVFHGAKEAQHAFLKDVTRNNLFADTGTSSYRFALVPAEALPDTAREEMMDRRPWTYLVMAQEWEREKQNLTERTAVPETRDVSDPRNYLYVEFNSGPLSNPACDAKLAVQAKIRGAERWYSSDHATESLQIQSQSWRRSAIELPAGTTPDQVQALRMVAFPGKNAPNCALVLTQVRKVFLLGQDYVPGPSLFAWSGRQELDADASTAYPAEWVAAIEH